MMLAMSSDDARTGSRWHDGWYIVPWQVIFRDVDAFGHVNNAVYLTYFEWARAQLWFALTGAAGLPIDIGFIVARAEIDFKLQIAMEPIDICIRITEMRTTSFDTVYEIRKRGGKVAATGKVVVVLFDWKAQTKMPISDELRQKVRAFQQETPKSI
ncbi:MAG: acyl-CoA thioester hydrolase [Thermoanaerobaculia bacterium]|nr:acyl-CoA thioester hydrolase [Thermoanaerobaculia bacterium]